MKDTVTLEETYEAGLDQNRAKHFWAIHASMGNIIVGADASNAFTEVPVPTAPFYMKVDSQFHIWWKSI